VRDSCRVSFAAQICLHHFLRCAICLHQLSRRASSYSHPALLARTLHVAPCIACVFTDCAGPWCPERRRDPDGGCRALLEGRACAGCYARHGAGPNEPARQPSQLPGTLTSWFSSSSCYPFKPWHAGSLLCLLLWGVHTSGACTSGLLDVYKAWCPLLSTPGALARCSVLARMSLPDSPLSFQVRHAGFVLFAVCCFGLCTGHRHASLCCVRCCVAVAAQCEHSVHAVVCHL
jgi:hypothetical protein